MRTSNRILRWAAAIALAAWLAGCEPSALLDAEAPPRTEEHIPGNGPTGDEVLQYGSCGADGLRLWNSSLTANVAYAFGTETFVCEDFAVQQSLAGSPNTGNNVVACSQTECLDIRNRTVSNRFPTGGSFRDLVADNGLDYNFTTASPNRLCYREFEARRTTCTELPFEPTALAWSTSDANYACVGSAEGSLLCQEWGGSTWGDRLTVSLGEPNARPSVSRIAIDANDRIFILGQFPGGPAANASRLYVYDAGPREPTNPREVSFQLNPLVEYRDTVGWTTFEPLPNGENLIQAGPDPQDAQGTSCVAFSNDDLVIAGVLGGGGPPVALGDEGAAPEQAAGRRTNLPGRPVGVVPIPGGDFWFVLTTAGTFAVNGGCTVAGVVGPAPNGATHPADRKLVALPVAIQP